MTPQIVVIRKSCDRLKTQNILFQLSVASVVNFVSLKITPACYINKLLWGINNHIDTKHLILDDTNISVMGP